ncbi:syntaxin-81-like [Lycium ferocissimum]|uniref:syntaxin-81-like n=1 Tax=Lycium ferocissimum TaxID=112874 RepID=UPI0028164429|nr:syntaxin-81-like [Lycium ferocissimum]
MSKVRDRTEDFKDVAHRSALSLGYDESKTAALLASFIMHKPRQRSGFTRAALKTLENIGTLEQFLMKHKKDYVDLHRTTEQERDSIEHEVRLDTLISVFFLPFPYLFFFFFFFGMDFRTGWLATLSSSCFYFDVDRYILLLLCDALSSNIC